MKRAFRRGKESAHQKRRAKKWYSGNNMYVANGNRHSWADYWKEVKAGKIDNWLKDTGTPCSCCMCSQKYERPSAEDVRNIINEQLDDI